jgi:hypothetical protein
MNKSTGALTDVASTSTTVTCDGTVRSNLASFSDTYDPGNYVYYVEIFLQRSSSFNHVYAYGTTVY